MEAKNDIAYGIIPIRRHQDEWQVLLIHQYSRIGNNSYWILPKGHPEKGESPVQTAARELKEETGLTSSDILFEPTFNLEYLFNFEGVKINKIVKFYIGIINDSQLELDDEEVKEASWLSLREASERLDYQNAKDMFRKARAFIAKL